MCLIMCNIFLSRMPHCSIILAQAAQHMRRDRLRGGTMAVAGTKKWHKFPPFVEYANGCERFQAKTPANLRWAQNLSLVTLKRSGGPVPPAEQAWHELGAHLPRFQQFLDAIIGSRDKP